jgi:hypothetical protein
MHTKIQGGACCCTLGNNTASGMLFCGTVPLLICRLSNIQDDRQQSLPAEGVAGLLAGLTKLKDLTLHLRKRAEVGPAGPRLGATLQRWHDLSARWAVVYDVYIYTWQAQCKQRTLDRVACT